MATTGKQVYDLALVLMDSESNSADYISKAPAILTLLETELATAQGLAVPGIITDVNAELKVSDRTARLVYPYGLAAHLLIDENPDMASFFNQKFEELKRRIPRSPVPIKDVYSGVEE